jgi:hypothetical protein
MDTVMSHLAFSMATVGYCVARYARAEAIMAAILKMTRRYAQSWRDAQDAMPPQAGFTIFFDSC